MGVQEDTKAKIKLPASWLAQLADEFDKDYMKSLKAFLRAEINSQKKIFPKGENFFAAFEATEFEDVKVVILGQDPYHGPGQAHGLSFSVPEGVAFPPSLQNIFKELSADVGVPIPSSGNLIEWAQQGVLLLNSVLTVECHKAGSHQGKGWEIFTDQVIKKLNDNRRNIAFVLWGSYAQKKAAFVDKNKHLILASPHPSPLSSYRGFFGSRPFSKINEFLIQTGQKPIHW